MQQTVLQVRPWGHITDELHMKSIALGIAKVIAIGCLVYVGMHVARLVLIDEDWIFGALVVAGLIYMNFRERPAK